MAAYKPWVWCREPGCDTKLIFATRNGRRLPYEAQDRPPFETESIGCHVIVDGQAFTVAEALEHFQVRYEATTQKARELASGYPWHRPHFHEPLQEVCS